MHLVIHAECHLSIASFMLSVSNKSFMLSVVMLSVIMTSDVAPLNVAPSLSDDHRRPADDFAVVERKTRPVFAG